MLQFKPLTLDDKDLINSYLSRSSYYACEYSFTTLYIWRKALDIHWCILEDALIVRKRDPKFGIYFMPPIGYSSGRLSTILAELIQYKQENNMEYLFRNIEEGFLPDLKALIPEDQLVFGIEEDNFDYIYESEKLVKLPGRKLASKRNHYSRFVKSYDYRVEAITAENAAQCIEASKTWCRENGCDGYLSYEMKSITDMLQNIDRLCFHGIVVFVDNNCCAFTIGEKINSEMAVIHVEKAFTNYHGLYTFTNKTFAELYFQDVKYINREDDMGVEGLRKAKQSYYPAMLLYKHTVSFKAGIEPISQTQCD